MIRIDRPHRPTRWQLYRWTTWFQLANALLLALVALRYFAYATLPTDWLSRVFLVLMVPGHFLILTYLLLPLAVLPALVYPGRWVMGYAVALYSLFMAAVLVDTQVFSLYRFHLNGLVWNILVSGEAEQLLPISWAAFLTAGIVGALVVALEALVAWALWRAVQRRRSYHGFATALVLFALVLFGQGMHAWADAHLYTPITRQMQYLPWLRALTAYKFFYKHGWVPKRQLAGNTVPHGASGLHYPLVPLTCQAPAKPLNILFLMADGWRADSLNPQVTPNAWALAQQSLRFEHHFSTGNATRYGIFGLFYGLYGTYWDAMLSEEKGPVLIHQAIREGYRFAIHGSASLRFPEFDRTVFSELRNRIQLDTPGDTAPKRDEEITREFLDFIKQPSSKPFFAYLFYDSSHGLTYPPDFHGPFQPEWKVINRLELNNSFDPTPFFNRYRNSLYFVDEQMGKVIDGLKAQGLMDNTLIILTGDHGEEFNGNHQNYWGHNGDFSRWQTQTAMAIYWPGRTPHVYEHVTSHVDVAPTLLHDVLGCTTPADDYSNGRSLFDTSPRPYVVASNYVAVGLIQPNQITQMDSFGRINVVDPNYRELPNARPPYAYLQAMLGDMSRFYAH